MGVKSLYGAVNKDSKMCDCDYELPTEKDGVVSFIVIMDPSVKFCM